MNHFREAALEYAGRGFRVLPLQPGTMVPLTGLSVEDATTDGDQIRAWWTQFPDANLGVATGNRLAVLEVDPRQGGDKALTSLLKRHSNFPDWTLEAGTIDGDQKYWFQVLESVPSFTLANGLELKGEGSYVMAPPSLHPNASEPFWWAYGSNLSWDVMEYLPNWLASLGGSPEPADLGAVMDHFPEDGSSTSQLPGNLSDTLSTLATLSGPEVAGEEKTSDWHGFINAADVEPEHVGWLWPGRIPLGKLTLFDGDPGVGKSTLMMDLAARVSTGREMPDGQASQADGPGKVLLLSAEDGLRDTIVPRFLAAGGNRALLWAKDNTEPVTIPADLPGLQKFIEVKQVRLMIVDPLMAYLDGKVNADKDHDVRRALAPLAALADLTGCAILLVRHLNKRAGETNALYRGGGSIAITGAARSAMLVAKDPNDTEGRRIILASSKNNLAATPPSLGYHLESVQEGTSRLRWLGAVDVTANELLAAKAEQTPVSAVDEAVAFLEEYLADGPKQAAEVVRAAHGHSIADTTLKNARGRLAVQATQTGFGQTKVWWWSLPGQDGAAIASA